ncbi:MAG: DUF4917 family protein [Acidobacteriota bacterium]
MPTPQGPPRIHSYAEILQHLGAAPSLLLGNGFSIGASRSYSYQAIYDSTRDTLPAIPRELFDKLGTSNFEQVMQILQDSCEINERYHGADIEPLNEKLLADLEATRRAMVEAIARDHLPSPSALGEEVDALGASKAGASKAGGSTAGESKADYAAGFLDRYARIFTTNYDLLLYWLTLRVRDADGYKYPDGLRRPDGADYGAFDPSIETTMFFLHGALHLYAHEGSARKTIARPNLRLMTLIQRLLADGKVPLFIAEGTPDQKRQRIEANTYLRSGLDALRSVEGDLVVFGHGLGPSDAHLLDALAANPRLERLFVGLYKDPETSTNLRLRAALAALRERLPAGRRLEIHLYASHTAPVWGPVPAARSGE